MHTMCHLCPQAMWVDLDQAEQHTHTHTHTHTSPRTDATGCGVTLALMALDMFTRSWWLYGPLG